MGHGCPRNHNKDQRAALLPALVFSQQDRYCLFDHDLFTRVTDILFFPEAKTPCFRSPPALLFTLPRYLPNMLGEGRISRKRDGRKETSMETLLFQARLDQSDVGPVSFLLLLTDLALA